MTTFSAITTLDNQEAADSLGEALERLDPAPYGVGVFEIEDGSGRREVAAHFMAAPDAASLALCAAAFGAKPFKGVASLPKRHFSIMDNAPDITEKRVIILGHLSETRKHLKISHKPSFARPSATFTKTGNQRECEFKTNETPGYRHCRCLH